MKILCCKFGVFIVLSYSTVTVCLENKTLISKSDRFNNGLLSRSPLYIGNFDRIGTLVLLPLLLPLLLNYDSIPVDLTEIRSNYSEFHHAVSQCAGAATKHYKVEFSPGSGSFLPTAERCLTRLHP